MIQSKQNKKSAFTLLELIVTMTMVAILGTTVMQYLSSSSKQFNTNMTRKDLENAALNISEEIRNDLNNMRTDDDANWNYVNNSYFSGKVVTGYDEVSTSPLYGETVTWIVQYGAADPPDDVDNDGDGLIDEMELVRSITGAAGTKKVKTENIAEGTFILSKQGNMISFQLTLTKSAPGDPNPITYQANKISVALQ